MTTPTPDANGSIPPGYYQAEGDPPGLVRQWDGTQWVGGPIPPPPSTAAPAPGIGLPAANTAGIGVRIGAVLIDGLILFILIIAFTIPFAETTTTTDDGFEFSTTNGAGGYIAMFGYLALTVFLVSTKGGSLGKLALGLRVTELDGTTPPAYGPSTMRVVPWALTIIPLLGVLVWLGVAIAGTIMIANDDQRRSVSDRIGSTLVVRK
jgi:uncharacterized RDD family membrane protein YckC